MSRRKRLPIDMFHDSMEDAQILMMIASAFPNRRERAMRTELRNRVGEALRIKKNDRRKLECIENDKVFLLFKNKNHLSKIQFKDTRPLLRQAIVAGCAAFETYTADKITEKIALILRRNTLPKKMEEIPTTVGRLLEIENKYQRKIWGFKDIIKQDIIEQASTAPNKVGYLMSMVGIKRWAQKVDTERGLASGSTVSELNAITKRRNKIAHAADRVGSGRANLVPQETENYLTQILSIADAIENVIEKNL